MNNLQVFKNDQFGEIRTVEIGVSRKTIYNWETAGNIPQTALEKMADLFGCTTDYLLEKVD